MSHRIFDDLAGPVVLLPASLERSNYVHQVSPLRFPTLQKRIVPPRRSSLCLFSEQLVFMPERQPPEVESQEGFPLQVVLERNQPGVTSSICYFCLTSSAGTASARNSIRAPLLCGSWHSRHFFLLSGVCCRNAADSA